MFRNSVFYRKGLLAPRPTPKLEDHPSSALRDCLFNLFAATLFIGDRSSIRNLRICHAVVTGTHYMARSHFTPGKDPVHILQETGRAPEPVWTGGKSRPKRDSIPDHPAPSQSLYQLSYPAHRCRMVTYIKYQQNQLLSFTIKLFCPLRLELLPRIIKLISPTIKATSPYDKSYVPL